MARKGFPWFWVITIGGVSLSVAGWYLVPQFRALICKYIGANWNTCKLKENIDWSSIKQQEGEKGVLGGMIQNAIVGGIPEIDRQLLAQRARALPVFKNRRFPKLQKSR